MGRGEWQIYHEILQVISKQSGCPKTRAMQLSNLSWRSFKKHFGYLLDNNFVKNGNKDVSHYELTEEGYKLLNHLVEIKNTLK